MDNITEEAPIWEIVPFGEASHGMWNAYEEVTGITGPGFVGLNDELPSMSVESGLKKLDLAVFGGEIFVPQDKARMYGGEAKYVGDKMPLILRVAGADGERNFLYDNILAYCVANNLLIDAGGVGDNNYVILVVRFQEGVTQGLYSPENFKSGAMLDLQWINNGGIYKDTYNGKSVLGYGAFLKSYYGIQIASTRTVHAIVNIDPAHIPTATMLDTALASARATGKNTHLFMHPQCKTLLNTLKDSKMRTIPGDKNMVTLFDYWNDVPITGSYNFNEGSDSHITVPV